MCTAATYKTKDFYFGRTLDNEFSYEEEITVTPRNFPFRFRFTGEMKSHYAIIGMAHIADNYPLYYDALNEKGLCIAALNFVGNAHYFERKPNKDNVAHFEVILWLLGQCASVSEVKDKLKKLNITNRAFSPELPKAELHWLIADRKESITLESTKNGIFAYPNPVGVLTNNPPFEIQLFQLNNYLNLSPEAPQNKFSSHLNLKKYSNGMGAMGMPGDWSSQSRFVKASFVKMNSVCGTTEVESISQFFHILESVAHPRGAVNMGNNIYEITLYSSCCNVDRGIYYYKTYENSQITGIRLHGVDLDSDQLFKFPLVKGQQIHMEN